MSFGVIVLILGDERREPKARTSTYSCDDTARPTESCLKQFQ